jgi:uncharacterized membrane protein
VTNILRFLEVFALGTWVGGIIFLSFVVAPGVFGILSSRDQAGAVVALALSRLHFLGVIAGMVYLLAAVAGARSVAALIRPAPLAVGLMVLLTFVSQHVVSAKMRRLRQEMVSVDATPRESPSRIKFDRLHRMSVRLEGSVLLLGLAALFLTVRSKPL